jgi:cyclin T
MSASIVAPRSTTQSLDVSQLPSVKDGISPQEEADKRRKTCRFIEEAGRILKLPRVAVATAMVFFHRFYAKHSFAEHDRFEVAVACLLLAAKTEEAPKKLNTVIDECHKLKHRGMAAGRISQNSPAHPSSSSLSGSLDPTGEEFLKLKERILLLERVILHTIGFELSIDHPYKFLVDQVQQLKRQHTLFS